MDTRKLLIEQIKIRIINESIPRIIKCIDLLTDDNVWKSHNKNSNSIGVLILHLDGNLRQWLLSGLCGKPDTRNRPQEFRPERSYTINELKSILKRLSRDIEDALQLLQVEDLSQIRDVQCFRESGVSIVVHVIEHFSYHTGQIVSMTKFLTNQDLAFYGSLNLDQTQ